MNLSIIILSYNCQNDILNCLSSIYRFSPSGDFEIIVVDNKSTDETISVVKSKFPQIKLIENQENLGFAKANNMGARVAKGGYLFFLNPDTIINDSNIFNYLIQLLEISQKSKVKSQNYKLKVKIEEGIGITGPRLIDQDGIFQWSCGPVPSVFNMIWDKPLAFIYSKFPKLLRLLGKLSSRYYQGQKPIKVGFVSGAALMIKREVFEKLGGFDENFFLYFEDVDLCLRAQKLGYQVIYNPQISIVHLNGQSQKENLKLKERWYYQSQDYFFRKHKRLWEQMVVKILRLPYQLSGLRSRINKYY